MKRFEIKFEIKEDHLKLLKGMYVSWWNCEFGSPAVDCKRPYGNSDVIRDMAEILGIKPVENDFDETIFPKGTYDYCVKLHKEMETVIQIIFSTAQVSIGWYRIENDYGKDWIKDE